MMNTQLKKKITIFCIAMTIGLSSFGLYSYNQQQILIQQKQQYEQLLQQTKKVQDDYDKLQQEFKEYKVLHSAKQVTSNSRGGAMFTVYSVNSRIDTNTSITEGQLNKALKGTKMAGLGKYFIEAEERYQVDAIFLTSIAALESGWGTSDFSKNRNNLFGFCAYDGTERNNTSHFSSKEDCILKVAKFLSENYLKPSGQYYKGATPNGVNINYSSNEKWDKEVSSIMNTIIAKATK